MGHPADYEDNPAVVADKIFRYCMIRKALKEKLIENCSKFGVNEDFLIERYELGKSTEGYGKILRDVCKKRKFYFFVVDYILNRDK